MIRPTKARDTAPGAQLPRLSPIDPSDAPILASAAQCVQTSSEENDLRDFMENVPICLHSVDADGTILWANEIELSSLGLSRDEYVGHNIAEFHVNPTVIRTLLEVLHRHGTVTAYRSQLRRKDGSIRDVAISSRVLQRAGCFVHTRCVTLDVTAENEKVELQERMAAIVASSDDAIVSKDLNGIIRSWNQGAERIFGYTAEEIIGKHISTLAPAEVIDEIPTILKRIAAGDRVDHYRTKRRTKDGRVLTVSLTVSPIRDGMGNVIGASKVARDITDVEKNELALQNANAALKRSNDDLQQFAHSASHDLQEPLRMVATYTELLRRDYGGALDETADSYIEHAVQGAVRMEQMLKSLRTYLFTMVALRNPIEDVDANAALEKALIPLDTAITESGATITHDHLPSVCMPGFQLELVFQNLVGNALRYRGDESPQIDIQAERRDQEWLFSVRDNGIGIAEQYKEQIFEVFRRLHNNAEYPGTGMGLAICQRIIERAGGKIWVESEVERGSTFFFTIPLT